MQFAVLFRWRPMELHAIDAAEVVNGDGDEKREPHGVGAQFQYCSGASWDGRWHLRDHLEQIERLF